MLASCAAPGKAKSIMDNERTLEFFWTAREREKMRLLRMDGQKRNPPNGAMREWRYSNVQFSDDKTTQLIIDGLTMAGLGNSPKLFGVLVACRMTNNFVNIGKYFGTDVAEGWDRDRFVNALKNSVPTLSMAYKIHTAKGFDKITGIAIVADKADARKDEVFGTPFTTTQELWSRIRKMTKIGDSLAYTLVKDLSLLPIGTGKCEDVYDWATLSPPARAVLAWMKQGKDARWLALYRKPPEMDLELMQELLELSTNPKYWPTEWPQWSMMTVAHWLHQYCQYVKVAYYNIPGRRYVECDSSYLPINVASTFLH